MTDASVAGSVFISHASQDATAARTLCAAIETAGIPCWIAPRDVRPGEAYAAAIINAINDCRMLVLVLSKHAIDSPHVLREVERASSKRRPVLSVRMDGTALPPELEYFLSANQWLDASGGPVANILPALVESVRGQGTIAARPLPNPVSVRRSRGVLAIALVLVAAGLVFLVADKFWFSKRAVPPQPAVVAAAPVIPDKSVAVLPFVNMSEDKNNEYFSDGLSEELMGLLAQVPDLKVSARTSSFYFKGKQTTIAEIARTLGVAHVLEGSVRKSGNTLRITAQLIRAKDGYDMWSETYDRKLDDIFKIQDEISGAVVKALKVTLLQDGMPKAKPAANQEAYALFLQSRSLHYRGTSADVQKAIDYAQRSADLDPAFAPAWAALADSLVYQSSFGTPHDATRARAFSAAQTALRLDPKLSDGHLAMGRVLGELDWNWTAADVELRTALALDPNNVLALGVSSAYLLIRGRVYDALGFAQKAVALDAVSTDAIGNLGDVYFATRHFLDAVAAYRKATELNPTHTGVHGALGLALLANGNPAAALTEMQQEPDEVNRQYGLAMALDALGRHSEADRALAVLETGFAATGAGNIGSIYACRNQPDKAFAWFDRAYRQHDGWLISIKLDPCAKNIQSDARFKTLLAKLNLPV